MMPHAFASQVDVPAGTVVQKKVSYTNPYHQHRSFHLASNTPWLLSCHPATLELPPGATKPLGLVFDARQAAPGVVDVLLFINDEDDRNEECWSIRVLIST